MESIYLDYAAATPVDARVLAAMRPYFADNFYNPSANYLAAKRTRDDLELARAEVAQILGARPSEIIFTAGATEACNLAVHGIMDDVISTARKDGPYAAKANVVVSAVEHEAVLAPAGGYDCRVIKVNPDGRVDLADLAAKIDENTVLVSVMQANNEIGTVQPIKEIARIIQRKRLERFSKNYSDYSTKNSAAKPLYLMTDAAQAANYLDLHVSRLGVDLMVLNGGKIYGPKQSGILYVKTGTKLKPLITGGGQENGMRSGTENVAADIGFAVALEIAQKDRAEESDRLEQLRDYFFKELINGIPSAVINGSQKHRLPNNLHFTIPCRDNERLIYALDERGIMVAAGSACSASDEESSHVLKAIGLTDAEARASLRFTMGRATTKEQLDYCLAELAKLVA